METSPEAAAQLDGVDRGILHELERDAWNTTTTDIADVVDVSPSTVRNRIQQLTDDGVIRGCVLDVDYVRAGYGHQVLFTCTAPPDDRTAFADRALDVDGVVRVREFVAGEENVHVEAVADSTRAISSVERSLADVGLDVSEVAVVHDRHVRPLSYFADDNG